MSPQVMADEDDDEVYFAFVTCLFTCDCVLVFQLREKNDCLANMSDREVSGIDPCEVLSRERKTSSVFSIRKSGTADDRAVDRRVHHEQADLDHHVDSQ